MEKQRQYRSRQGRNDEKYEATAYIMSSIMFLGAALILGYLIYNMLV